MSASRPSGVDAFRYFQHYLRHPGPAGRSPARIGGAGGSGARLLVCDIQECYDNAEPLVAYAPVSVIRDASRVAVELQGVLLAIKKTNLNA